MVGQCESIVARLRATWALLPRADNGRSRARASAVLASLFLCLGAATIVAICAFALGHTLSDLHRDAIDRSRFESKEFAAVLAGQTSRSVEAINIVLEEIVRHTLPFSESRAQATETFGYLRQKLAMLPAADVISIADANGNILNLTRTWPAPLVNIADRDYFRAAKREPQQTLIISEPAANRVTGTTIVYFSQRIDDDKGNFAGTVNIGVSPERLVDAHASDTQVDGRTLVLARRDGVVLAHSQSASAVGSWFPAKSPWHTAVAAGGGGYRSPGYFDKVTRLVVVQPLKNWPLVVNVSQREDAALANYHQVRRSTLTYAFAALVIALILVAALLQNYRKLGQAQATAWKWAHEDALTGLPNRRLLVDHLDNLMKEEGLPPSAILFVDLDRFKAVNDSLGHAYGDELLQQAAGRLRALFRPDDIVARIGGDEFVVVARNVDAETAPILAQRVVEHLSHTFTLMHKDKVNIGASIGVSLFSDTSESADKLIDDADRALYKAKMSGRGCYFIFKSDLEDEAKRKMLMDARMRSGLRNGEFELYYQPIVALEDGRITGCEALLRWNDPEEGLVMPGEFIPLAQETGFIAPLSQWVLDAAVGQIARWQTAGLPVDFVAVNLCAPHFESEGFLDDLELTLAQHCVEARHVTLEITESMAMRNQDHARARLLELGRRGFRIALDDFGTGYSSLAILRDMPIHRLKLDRAFVKDLTTNSAADAIIASIVDLAGKLELQVIAEGVETQAQMELLMQLGCDFGQGYLLGRPMPAPAFTALLDAPAAGKQAAA